MLLKQSKAEHQSQMAAKLGFTEKTVRECLKRYQAKGFTSFIAITVRGNNTGHLSDEAVDFVAQELSNPSTTITSYVEPKETIETQFGRKVNYGALYAHSRRKQRSKLKGSRKSHNLKTLCPQCVLALRPAIAT